MIRDNLKGEGRLISRSDQSKEYQVSYNFDITTDITEKPGFPRVAAKSNSKGTVRALDGRYIPEGEYDLHCENEILRVKNIGSGHILAPI